MIPKVHIFHKNLKFWQFSCRVVNTLTAKTSSSTWPINIPDIDLLPPTLDESSVFFTLREEREMTQLRIQVLQAWKRCLKVTGNVFKNDPPALTIGKPQIPRFTVTPRGGTAARCVLEKSCIQLKSFQWKIFGVMAFLVVKSLKN